MIAITLLLILSSVINPLLGGLPELSTGIKKGVTGVSSRIRGAFTRGAETSEDGSKLIKSSEGATKKVGFKLHSLTESTSTASTAVQDLGDVNPLNSETELGSSLESEALIFSNRFETEETKREEIVSSVKTPLRRKKYAKEDRLVGSDQEVERTDPLSLPGPSNPSANVAAKNSESDAYRFNGYEPTDAESLNELTSLEPLEIEHLSLKEMNSLRRRKIAINLGKDLGKTVVLTGFVAGVGFTTLELAKHLSNPGLGLGSGSKFFQGGLILVPSNVESPILSNVQSTTNATKQPEKKKISPGVTGLIHTTPESTSRKQKSSDFVIKHSLLNTKRAHSSMRKSIVYIVIIATTTLLLIAVAVIAFKMQQIKLKKEDLFTDMNQYYTNGAANINSVISSYPNTSSNQRNHLI